MALALNGTYPRVDVESLLWEMRDILRGLSQINKAQSAEIERLGGHNPVGALVAAEYDERAQAAIQSVDITLDQLLDTGSFVDDDAEASTEYNLNIAAWIEATNASLNLPQYAADAPETLLATASSTPSKDVPNDFWDVHEFKWEDEPEDNTNVLESSTPNASLYSGFEDPAFDEWEASSLDDELSPSDSVTERALDDDDFDLEDDDVYSGPHSSSNDDSATLFHPPEDQITAQRAVEPHAFGTGQKAQALADVASKASLLTMEQPFTSLQLSSLASSAAHVFMSSPIALAAF